GARALAESVPNVVGERPVTAVVSILEDKDAAGILSSLVPLCEGAVFTRSSRQGVLPPAVLESLWGQLGGSGGQIVPGPAAALASRHGIPLTFALFGISDDGLNLAVNLLVFFLVVIWVALVYWTYSDATRRLDDPLLIGCATVASLFPFIGTVVYTIVRPPEY